MQIHTSYHTYFSHYPKPNPQEPSPQEEAMTSTTPIDMLQSPQSPFLTLPPLGELQRQTYGLSILELMSDDEYRAFLRATAEMTENEKIMAAQSLYRLSELYQGKIDTHANLSNPYTNQSFLTTYQNAYQSILTQKIN